MFRTLFLMLVLLFGLIIGPYIAGEQGYVLIRTSSKNIEMSIVTLVIFFVIAMAGIYLLEWVVLRLLRLSRGSYRWFATRRERKAQRQTQEGLMQLAEGNYAKAERLFGRNARHSADPLLNLLKAAEAAQHNRDELNANHYLLEAERLAGKENLAVELTRARILFTQQKLAAARSQIDSLLEIAPKNVDVLALALTIYQQAKAYVALEKWLPAIERYGVVKGEALNALKQEVNNGIQDEILREQGEDGLLQWWENLPRAARNRLDVRSGVISRLIEAGNHPAAEKLALDSVKRGQDEQLPALLQSLIHLQAPADSKLVQLLIKREASAKTHREAFTRALAFILARDSQYGLAKGYFERLLDEQQHQNNDLIMATFVADKLLDIPFAEKIKQADKKQHVPAASNAPQLETKSA